MRSINLNIAIPSNVLEDCSDLRAKTVKIGQIARAAAIFKVRKIIVYSISKAYLTRYSSDIELIKETLEYLDCPQYLRRIIFPKLPILKYVGILPPLRTPHHPLENTVAKIPPNSIREGAVLYSNGSYSELEIGLEMPLKIPIPNLPKKRRIIVQLEKKENSISGIPITRETVKEYWGYETQIFRKPLQNFVSFFSNYTVIATSKRGNTIKRNDSEFLQHLMKRKEILILFGSPSLGLFEIFEKQGLSLENSVDFIINIVPNQGTKTVRVEEAILSALAIIHYIVFSDSKI